MIQRGRKSAARLATVTTLPGQRPAAPKSLTPGEAKVWKATVATKPANWFTADSHPLLIGYCRAVVMADQLSVELVTVAVMLTAAGASTEEGALKAFAIAFGMRKELLKQRNAEVDKITSLARSMRLTQQSRLKAETANTAHRDANGSNVTALKPWQTA